MTDQEKAFYMAEKAKWQQAVEMAESRALYQQREKAQKLKDEMYVLAHAIVTCNGRLSPVELDNLKSGISAIYDELTKLGLMSSGDMRYRK